MSSRKVSLNDLIAVCGTFEHVVHQSFGPNALSTMLCTTTGKVMVTSNGMSVLQSLKISNPIGQMITKSIQSHYAMAGDGCKTFLFILTDLLRHLNKFVSKDLHNDKAQNGNELLLMCAAFSKIASNILPKIICHLPCYMKVDDLSNMSSDELKGTVYNLICTSLHGRYSQTVRNHFAKTCTLLFPTSGGELSSSLTTTIDFFHLIVVESPGQLPENSRMVNGIIIQRDFMAFAAPLQPLCDVKFVLFGCVLEQEDTSDDCSPTSTAAISVKSTEIFRDMLQWKSHHVSVIISALKAQGIQVILSSRHVSDTAVHMCREVGIFLVHVVAEDELERLAWVGEIHIIQEIGDLCNSQSHVGHAQLCQNIVVGGHKFVQISGIKKPQKQNSSTDCDVYSVCAKQLIVCGLTPGMCQQYTASLLASLKSVRMWLDPERLCSALYAASDGLHVKQEPSSPESMGRILTVSDPSESESKTKDNNCDLKNNSVVDLSSEISENSDVSQSCEIPLGMNGISVPGGGAFELALSDALKAEADRCSDHVLSRACTILSKSLLCVPIRLVQNSFKQHATSNAQAQLLKILANKEAKTTGINARTGNGPLQDPTVVEPLAGKVLLVFHVLQLLQQLLRLDSVVSVRQLQVEPQSDELELAN